MKKIVTILSAALVLLASAPAFAQASIGAGYLSSTELWKSGNSSTQSTPMNGFYAGVGYTVPIANGINFTPGIYYGFATKDNVVDLAGIFKINGGKQQDHYLNIPLDFSFGVDMSSDLRFFVYGGPSLSLALASNLISGSTTVNRFGDNSDLNRFDIMLGGGVGIEVMKAFRINVGYDFGMLNRYNNSNTTCHRNQLTAGVAFLF